MSERRKTPRIKEEHLLVLYLVSAKPSARHRRGIHVLGIDISTSGVRCRIADFVPIDTRVRLDIQLSDKAAELSALGNVRWAHKLDNVDLYEIGIEFDDVSPDFTHALQKHIKQRLESGWDTV